VDEQRDLLPFLADLEDIFVIDHMGYLTEPDPQFEPRLLALLAQGSCWIKLSGAYRVAKSKPLSSVAPWGRALVAARPGVHHRFRVVTGARTGTSRPRRLRRFRRLP
jgi:predicted TIM-barrel fold metal-dependent hydrolase